MDTHLTDLGRNQAKLLNEYFINTKETFDKVYSSDLTRAYETCQICCGGRHEITTNKLLRERSFGVLQGSPLQVLRVEAYKAGYNEHNFTQYRPEGGETMEEVSNRIKTFCQEELIPNISDSASVLIVTHGGVIREFMKFFRVLGCKIENKDFVITPSTGISRFKIEVDKENHIKSVCAIVLHSIPHLSLSARSEALTEEQLNDSNSKGEKVEYAV